MDKKPDWIRRLRTAASLVLVALYFIGLVAMMTFSFQTGLILWVVSTLGGIGLLYWIHTVRKREEALSKAAEGSESPAPEGEGKAREE